MDDSTRGLYIDFLQPLTWMSSAWNLTVYTDKTSRDIAQIMITFDRSMDGQLSIGTNVSAHLGSVVDDISDRICLDSGLYGRYVTDSG